VLASAAIAASIDNSPDFASVWLVIERIPPFTVTVIACQPRLVISLFSIPLWF